MGIRSLVKVGAASASVMALMTMGSAASAHWVGTHAAGASSRAAGASSSHPSTARMFHTSAGPAHSDDVTLESPICTILGNGKTGAAAGMLPTDNADALNILAFGLTSDSKSITAQIKVTNLTDGPGGGPNLIGTADDWYVFWANKGSTYLLHANYGGAVDTASGNVSQSLWSFYYGRQFTLPVLGVQSQDDGDATGSIDASHGIITISAPLSAFNTTFDPSQVEAVGKVPGAGDSVDNLASISYYEQGSPGVSGPASQAFINPSDTLAADKKATYKIGTSC